MTRASLSTASKKRFYLAIRIAVCGLALWFVARGVTLDDRLVAGGGADVLFGTILEEENRVTIVLRDGTTRAFEREALTPGRDEANPVQYGLRSSWRMGAKSLLILAAFLHLPVAFLLALRLQGLLSVQDIHLSYGHCVKLSFAGNFLNFATPLGSNAGDVFKAYFITRLTHRKTEAATTVALDRVVGLATLLVVVALIALAAPRDGLLAAFRNYLLTVLGIALALLAAYWAPPLRRWGRRIGVLAPPSLLEQIRRIDSATRALLRRPSIVAVSILETAALQALAIAAYIVVAGAFGMRIGWDCLFEYYAYFALGAVVQSLPGPPQGLGTVELAYRYFFASYGSPSQILCVAFFIRLVVLVCALPGAWYTFTGSYRPTDAGRPPAAPQGPNPMASDRATPDPLGIQTV